MKNNLKIVLSLVLVIVVIVAVVFFSPESDAVKFKLEYESLNGQTNDSGQEYPTVSISSTNPIVYADYDQIFDILDGGTGVIYFGFPECPWCRNMISVFLEAADEIGIESIYYLNNKEDRDTKVLEDDEVITEKEGTSNYNELLERLGEYASVYEGLNDESIKRLYFPTVIFVKDGEIIEYIEGTVDSQDDPYTALTDEQEEELKEKYIAAFQSLTTCDLDSKC